MVVEILKALFNYAFKNHSFQYKQQTYNWFVDPYSHWIWDFFSHPIIDRRGAGYYKQSGSGNYYLPKSFHPRYGAVYYVSCRVGNGQPARGFGNPFRFQIWAIGCYHRL